MDQDDSGGVLALLLPGLAQVLIRRQLGLAVHTDDDVIAGHHEHQRYSPIAHNVAQAVDPVVAAPVGHRQRLVVEFTHNRTIIAARRAVDAFRAYGGHHAEPAGFDPFAIGGCHPVCDFQDRGRVRLAIMGLKRLDAVDCLHQPRPMKGMVVAMMVWNCTLVSSE